MDALRRFIAIVHADVLERCRNNGSRLLLLIGVVLSWWCFPAADATYLFLGANSHYRGEYSSAWVGMIVAMLSLWISLVGFYIVRGTLVRDIESKVWELLAVTSLSRPAYLMAKWCSHMLIFILMLTSQLAIGLLAQAIRAEDHVIDLAELIKPVALLAIPSLALTATFALWFDLLPWLRRTAGNAIYLLLWVVILIASAATQESHLATRSGTEYVGDPRGMHAFKRAMDDAMAQQIGPDARVSTFLSGTRASGDGGVNRLAWQRWEVTPEVLTGRAAWLALAIAAALLGAPLLDRLARNGARSASGAPGTLQLAWLDRLLAPLQRKPFGTMLAAELALTLRQRHVWWWCAMALVTGFEVFGTRSDIALAVIVGWVLLLDIFSRASLRDHELGTAPLVLSAARAASRVRNARWLMVLITGQLFALPAVLRLMPDNPMAAMAIVVAGASIASWGLALGALTRNARPFELILCALAYIGLEGSTVMNVSQAPAETLQLHLFALVLASVVFVLSWRRLNQAA